MSPETQEDSPQDMQQLLDEMDPIRALRRGEIVEGVVMRAESDGIFINTGYKTEGFVPPTEMRTLSPEELVDINEGDTIVAFVLRPDSPDGPILSIDRAKGEEGWRELQKFLDDDAITEGTVIGFNRGGCILEVSGVHGFVPTSQLVTIPREQFRQQEQEDDDNEKSLEDAQSAFIGNILKVKVLEVNRARNRAIFSERSASQVERDEQRAKLILEINEGDIRRGTVTGISNFGAFVDLGGADGLIHISELSWSMVSAPEEIVTVGQEMDVFVLGVDRENNRIALSLRRMEPEPWQTINDRYKAGDVVDARITKLANFGAFARIEDAIEGLIHITELTSKVIAHPQDVVSEGEDVKVKILRIEPERRRLGLSLRQVEEGFEQETDVVEEE